MKPAIALLVVQLGCWSKPDLPSGDDGVPGPIPTLSNTSHLHALTAMTLTFPLTVSPIDNRFLVVAAAMSGDNTNVPGVMSITYANVPLSPLAEITGVPAGSTARSEQWQLLAPPVGTADVAITLVAGARTIHGSAMVFGGVNQTSPVRAFNAESGQSMTSSVVVLSAVNDLVESTVATGTEIFKPAGLDTPVFIDNVDSAFALNNSGASTTAGLDGQTELDWDLNNDVWQTLGASLQPILVPGT